MSSTVGSKRLDDRLAQEVRRQVAAGDLRAVRRARLAPGQARVEEALADVPALQAVELDGQGVLDLGREVAEAEPEAPAHERPHRVLHEAHEVVELDRARRAALERRGQERRRGRPVGRQRARPGERGVVEAPRPVAGEHAGTEVARVEGLQRMADEDAAARGLAVLGADRPVDDVEQLADRDRGRALGVRALVVAGVGHEQPVAGGHDRVEQKLAVLARGSRSPTRGSSRRRSSPSRGALRGNTASSRPRRQTTRWGTERIGTSVQKVRCPVRKFARVGRPCSRSSMSARISESASATGVPPASWSMSSSRRCSSARCQASRSVVAVSRSAAVAIDCVHAATDFGAVRSSSVTRSRSTSSASRPGEVDRAAVDVVERQDPVDQAAVVLGHRHADEDALQARVPRAVLDGVQLERRAGPASSPPAHAALGDPLLQAHEVVVVEAEAPAHRVASGEVEHLRRGHPVVGELEQLRDDTEHGVGLAQRAVGEPDAQVGRLIGAALLVLVGCGGPERRVHERRERLDVRAHDDHVARLERRVLLQQVQQGVAQDLDLPRAAVAAVDLDAAVAGGQQRPCVGPVAQGRARGAHVGAHVGLDAPEQGLRRAVVDEVVVVGPVGRARGEHELHLAGVLAPRGQQPVGRQRGGVVVRAQAARRRRGRDALPQRGGGVQENRCTSRRAARASRTSR
jgi:hypothetical protein